MTWLLRIALLMVIVAELNSLWIAVTDLDTYLKVFPRATGAIFILSVLASAAAAANAVMLWLGKPWAIRLNVLIGLVSIVLLELAGGPRSNQLIVLVACAVTTGLAAFIALRSGATANPSR
jgi:hypothetical protein